jgi:LPPG:FO 2-phospho-L-lactate transferase
VSPPVVVLAGGTGGAKLARGMLDVVGAEDLVVIANTGDDIEIYGAYVSPDPDLVTFWLADQIDERGWGLRGDTFNVMDGLRALGVEVWFNLGDRDLAIGLERQRALRAGRRLTEAQGDVAAALGVGARVLPMSDHPVRTHVLAHERWWPFQEFMIKAQGRGPVDDVGFRGARASPATPEALEAIANAHAIVVGPSNPVISIGPILALADLRQAISEARAPVVAVSPIVEGEVIKGPTAAFMEWAGHPLDAAGVAAMYARLIDGLVADGAAPDVPLLQTDTLMSTPHDRARVAHETLDFALTLRQSG